MAAYAVSEILYTLQGKGRHAGRAAVFCRFAGCNLWSGRERDRATATCRFCYTDFVGVDGEGGGRFRDAVALAQAISDAWIGQGGRRLVVLTGGEPLLQVNEPLIERLHALGFEAVETNGTLPAPTGHDRIAVSPKADAALQIRQGDELKLVYAQPEAPLDLFEDLPFTHYLLQPMDGAELAADTSAAVAYCLANPRWRLSLQSHKVLGIP